MSRIAGVLHVERRTDQRYGVELRVQYAWEGRILHGVTLDISKRGMRLQTEVDLGRGNHLVAYFQLPNELEMHQVRAEVMWVAMSERILGLYECGLQFQAGDSPALRALKRLIGQLAGGEAEEELPLAAEDDVVELAGPLGVSPQASQGAIPNWPSSPNASWSPDELTAALAADHQKRDQDRQLAEQKLAQGRQLLRTGDPAQARAILEEAAQLMPHSADVLESLGEALYRQGDVAGAASAFDRALRLRQE